MSAVDLNSDLGEGFGRWSLGDDEQMLGIVSSANVACGFHAGDPASIRRTVRSAVAHGVTIGAHVGYRDLAGFGRRNMDVPDDELEADVAYQIGALRGLADAEGGVVTYVKPHGALYNAIATHEAQAAAVVEAVTTFDPSLAVLGMPGSRWLALAEQAGLETVAEAFADRAYTPDGRLVSRREPGAVLHDPEVVARRAVRFATDATVVAVDGSVLSMPARSVCVHSDTPGALELVQAVRAGMAEAGVRVESFR